MTPARLTGIHACVFDAYGTLFDVNSAAAQAKDAHAAKACGFRVLWCNRFGQPPERIPESPDGEIETLSVLPDLVSA